MADNIFAGYGDLPRQMAQLSLQQQQVQQAGELQRAQMAQMPAQTAYVQAQTAAIPAQTAHLKAQTAAIPLQQSLLHHQITAQGLTTQVAQHHYAGSRLADIGYLPPNQQAGAYQNIRNELVKTGVVKSTDLPEQFDQNAQNVVNAAVSSSPASAAQRKFQQQAVIQELKNRGLVGAAQAKKAPLVTQFEKAEAPKNTAFFDALGNNATSAGKINQDVDEIMGAAGQIPGKFGIVSGNMIRLSPEGQLVNARMKKMVLDMFAQMPHVGRGGTILLNTITQSKLSPTMKYSALKQLADTYRAASNLSIEKNKFGLFLKENGIHDRNRVQMLFDEFQEAYPMVDKEGKVDPKVPSKWMEFLRDNPQLLRKGHPITTTATKVPTGFQFPAGTPGVSPGQAQTPTSGVTPAAPQAGPSPTAPAPIAAAGRMGPNPYDFLNRGGGQ